MADPNAQFIIMSFSRQNIANMLNQRLKEINSAERLADDDDRLSDALCRDFVNDYPTEGHAESMDDDLNDLVNVTLYRLGLLKDGD